MNETADLFDIETMQEFKPAVAPAQIPTKPAARAFQLLQSLFAELNGRTYDSKPTIDYPILARMVRTIGKTQLYCLIWTVAYDPPIINGRYAALSPRFISYHSEKLLTSPEYVETLAKFDDAAMVRVEERIDAYVRTRHLEGVRDSS